MSELTTGLHNQIKSFMREVKQLQYYQVLKSSDNEEKLVKIEGSEVVEINLSGHAIPEIPASISYFPKLRKLTLNNCKITSLPEEIDNLSSLQYLSLENNQLTQLPDALRHLYSMTHFVGKNCGSMKSIDGSIFENISFLTHLDLSELDIKYVEGGFNLPTSLELLNLSSNNLSSVEFHGIHEHLKQIDLGGNSFDQIPSALNNFPKLEVLHLDNNTLKEIDSIIAELYHLRIVNLSENRITKIPIEFYTIDSLEVLQLQMNNIDQIGSEVAHLQSLKELWLENNQLTSLPKDIGRLANLEVLRLNNNHLTGLPVNILNLHLKELNLLQNNLPAAYNFLCPNRETVKEFYVKIAQQLISGADVDFIDNVKVRELSKLHVFLSSGEALATFNGLTETIAEMDPPLAGVFQIAMNIIDTEGKSFIPIKDEDERSIQITVNDDIGLGFDFLGVHPSIELHNDDYLHNAISNFIYRHGDILRDKVFDLDADEIKFAFILYLA